MSRSTTTASDGTYTISAVTVASYYIKTSNGSGMIDQIITSALNPPTNPTLPSNLTSGRSTCVGCIVITNNSVSSALPGQPVSVGNGQTITADFFLAAGLQISGNVSGGGSGRGNANVTIFTSTGATVGNVSTSNVAPVGSYQTMGLLGGQFYFVKTSNVSGFVDAIYNGAVVGTTSNCLNCTLASTGTTVAAGSTNINLNLNAGFTISGRISGVSSSTTGIGNAQVSFFNSSGTSVSGIQSSNAAGINLGTYTSTALPAGQYYVATTTNNSTFLNKLYNAGAAGGGTSFSGSNTQASFITGNGSLVNIASANATAIDLALVTGSTISGTVRIANTSTGIQGISVQLVNANNAFVGSQSTSASGAFSFTGLTNGTYFVRSQNSGNVGLGFIDKVYTANPVGGVTCTSSCNPTQVGLGIFATGENFPDAILALVVGGRISGRVTRTDTLANISGVQVQAYDSTQQVGQFLGSATTAADGTYTIAGLAAGSYTVKTSNSAGFLDELYNDIPCTSCSTSAGQALPVTAGNTVPNINFALVLGGTISGTITNASTSAPVSNVSVSFYNSNGQSVGNSQTNASGVYTSPGLPTATYFVVTTNNSAGLINKLYNGFNCLGCTNSAPGGGPSQVVNGTPVNVTAGSATTGINMALSPGLTIAGAVRNGSTLLSNVSVQLFTAAGGSSSLAGSSTGPTGPNAGLYTLPAVPPGTYFVKTNASNSTGVINQVYKPGTGGVTGVTCGNSCTPSQIGQPIVLTTANATGIDFLLASGGSVNGRVTATTGGANIPNVPMSLFDVNNPSTSIANANTDASGNYSMGGLAAGSYYVKAQSTGNFIGEVFDNIPCPNCTVSSAGGAAVAVAAGTPRNNIDFQLASGGTITGTVTSSAGPALQGVSVQLSTASSSNVGAAQTNSSGVFSISGLPAGTYYAKTSNSQGFIDEIFDNVVCQTCFGSNANGTAIPLAVGETKTANFSLVQGRRVSGRVTDSVTGNPIPGISVGIFNSTGNQLTSGTTNDAGNYQTQVGLAAGSSYFAKTVSSSGTVSGYINKLYNNIPCVNCPVSSGAPIALAGTDVTGIDFALSPGGRVTGTITDSQGAGVQGVSVNIYSAELDPQTRQAQFLGSGFTGPTGAYAVGGLPGGSMVAKTSNSLGYIDEIYDDVKCATCGVTTGKTFAVTVGNTTAGIDFALGSGARITGTVTNTGGTPLPNVSVGIYNASNTQVSNASTNQLGVYTSGGLVPGTYFARTTFTNGYVNQLYSGLPCATCTAANGTPIVVSGTTTVPNIDFTLSAGSTISGTVLEGAGTGNGAETSAVGSPIPGTRVSIYDSGNAFVTSTTVLADGTYRATGLAAGTYFAKTSNEQGFIDRMYNGVACLFCSLTGGTPIVVGASGDVPNINFELTRGGSIAGTVTDASSAPLANITVNLIGAGGQFLRSLSTDGLGRFTFGGLANGSFYLRTQNTLGYIDKLYNNVVCSSCNPLTGAPVKIIASGNVTNINFSLEVGGFVAGTITSPGNAPIENITVSVFGASGGSPVATGFTNANGVYKTGAVPTGTYFVKTNNNKGFVDQLYLGKECNICNPTTGTPVAVTTGQPTTGIDFALSAGGRVSGTVTSGGTPVPGVNVTFFNAAGKSVGSAQTDGTGRFLTFGGLPTGTYYARTNNSAGLVDKIYNDVTCVSCPASTGTPIPVTIGVETTGVNFSLVAGARISGTIVDAATQTPIANGRVDVFSSNGYFVTSATSGNTGTFITNSGLNAGTYYARANTAAGHIAKMFNNVDCPACSPLKGTPIVLAAAETRANVNFSLTLGGLISGTVRDQVTGAPISSGESTFLSVQIFNQNNNLVATAGVDPAGRYTSGSGLPTGTYYARTTNNQGYINKLYPNAVCLGGSGTGGTGQAGGGVNAPLCLPSAGAPIAVVTGQTTPNIDFRLAIGVRLGGRLTDAATGQPLLNAGVKIFDALGRAVTGGATDNAGNFVSDGGLPPGTYFAIANAFDQGYAPMLFSGVSCLACNPTLGTPIVVTSSRGGVDFALTKGGGFSGAVKSRASSVGLSNIKLSLYSATGSLLGSGTTDGAGKFEATGLPPGTYFVRTTNLLGWIDQSYQNNACAPCIITAATPITITAGASVTGLDFLLDAGGLVSGTVSDNLTGAPLPGVTVAFYLPNGTTFVGRSEPSDENGYYAISLPVGTYIVRPDPVQGYTPVANQSASFSGRVTAADSVVTVTQGGESTVTYSLETCAPPTVAPAALDLLSIGTAYTTTLTATGVNAPYTFAVAEGSLPLGISLNSTTGVLSGTPTTRGTANFTIAATGSNACSGTTAYAQVTRGVSLASLDTSLSSDGGSGTIVVTAESAGVVWSASSNVNWITLVGGTSGTGSGTVSYLVAANTGAARTGLITIAGEAFTVTQAQPSRPRLTLDTPRAGDALNRSFQISGWGLDLDASTGVGVDLVQVYASPIVNSVVGAETLLGEATASARADVAAFYGNQFLNSGFVLNVSNLAAGTYRLRAQARSTVTGRFDALQNADVTVTAPDANPVGVLDLPAAGATVGATFTVSGWAVDLGDTGGAGIDAVHVYAYPLSGGTLGTPTFLGIATLGGSRPDVGSILGSRFSTAGYTLEASGLSAGSYRIVAYARSVLTGTFGQARFNDVTVDVPIPNPVMFIDGPLSGATLTQPILITGWAADLGARSGTGVDTVHIYAINAESGGTTFLGPASYGSTRLDVGAVLGSQFDATGYSLTVSDLPAGTYDLVVYAHDSITGTFNQAKVVRVTVQ